jgi:hypothetical protein
MLTSSQQHTDRITGVPPNSRIHEKGGRARGPPPEVMWAIPCSLSCQCEQRSWHSHCCAPKPFSIQTHLWVKLGHTPLSLHLLRLIHQHTYRVPRATRWGFQYSVRSKELIFNWHTISQSQRVVLTLAQTILPHQSHVCHYSNPSVWIVVTLLLVSSLHRTFHSSLILHTDLKWLPLSFQYVRLLWIEEILLKKWRNFWMRWELIIFSSKFSFNSKEA